MLKMYINNSDYAHYICADVVSDKNDADVEVYVLSAGMSSVALMQAFQACRTNPMKAYYYIDPSDEVFAGLAENAIRRGTLHIFSSIESLALSINGKYDMVLDTAVRRCLKESAENYCVEIDDIDMLCSVVKDTIDRYGVYAAMMSVLRMLQSGRSLSTGLYSNVLRSILPIYASVENSVNSYRECSSQLVSVLAAARIFRVNIKNIESYDAMTLHVMLKPIRKDTMNLDDRRDVIVRVAKENIL